MKLEVAVLCLGMVALCLGGVPRVQWRRTAAPPACACPVEVAGVGVGCVDDPRARPGDRWRVSAGGVVRERMDPARLAALDVPIDLNRASAEELASLDGIGERLSARIIAARQRHRFDSVADLARVGGLGDAKIAALATRLRVDDGPADGLH